MYIWFLNIVLKNVEKYLNFTYFPGKIEKNVEYEVLLMFECWIDIWLKESKFHVFFKKIRKKVENHVYLMFEYCIEKCRKVSKFHVFSRKNRKKCRKWSTFDVWILNWNKSKRF